MELVARDADIPGRERARGNFTVLPRQITDLARLRLRRIARRHLATHVRIQMSERTGAVAVGRNGLIMDVID